MIKLTFRYDYEESDLRVMTEDNSIYFCVYDIDVILYRIGKGTVGVSTLDCLVYRRSYSLRYSDGVPYIDLSAIFDILTGFFVNVRYTEKYLIFIYFTNFITQMVIPDTIKEMKEEVINNCKEENSNDGN